MYKFSSRKNRQLGQNMTLPLGKQNMLRDLIKVLEIVTNAASNSPFIESLMVL